jgi:streptomycin 6-kinase
VSDPARHRARSRVEISIPEVFSSATIEREGADGLNWLEALPDLIEHLCETWDLEVDGPTMHGYVGVVIPVSRGGTPYVLKISWIDEWSRHEALALSTWAGRGAVRLIDAEPSSGAMLLERLDHRHSLEGLPVDEATRIAGKLLRRLAVPAPTEIRAVSAEGARMRRRLPELWEHTGKPFEEPLLDEALGILDEHGDCRPDTIVNQDLHFENILAGEREPWLVIDPKVLAGDLEFGAAPLLWNRFSEMRGPDDLRQRLAILADAAELEPLLARDWSHVRILEYWLWAIGVGLTDDPKKCRTLVDWLRPERLGRCTP